jgi:glycerophosphoryl diester phosphodiesterase
MPRDMLPPIDAHGPGRLLLIAHRGAADLYPENTTEAYRAALASGLRVLEQDVCTLGDGALGVMHDATVDRTTFGTGKTQAFDRTSWRRLRIRTQPHHGPAFDDIAPPLFDDVLAEFKDRVLFVPEAKTPGSGPALVDALLRAGIARDHALVQAFALDDLVPAVQAGYPAMFLTRTASDIAAARALGATWVGINRMATDSVFRAWIAAGFKATAYTIGTRAERDRLLALGVSGFFSDDPHRLMADG